MHGALPNKKGYVDKCLLNSTKKLCSYHCSIAGIVLLVIPNNGTIPLDGRQSFYRKTHVLFQVILEIQPFQIHDK